MDKSACPNRDELLLLSGGVLSEDEMEEIFHHVDTCPHCLSELETLESISDPILAPLQHLSLDPYLEEPQRQKTVDRIKALSQPAQEIETPSDAAETADKPLGQLGDYQLLSMLGEGGMGAVYMARHSKLHRLVALKLLHKGRADNEQAVARFEREMKAVGQLQHPNIVQAYDAREIEGTQILAMEYIEGLNLVELIRRLKGQVPVADACEIIRQVALALQSAHAKGLVHRDIKPSNIMIARGGHVKLLDLGLALLQGSSIENATNANRSEITCDGQVMGTVDYMAPEQCCDSHHVDIRADIYSLGCTLYALLCGKSPFSGPKYNSAANKIAGHLRDKPRPLKERRADVPAALLGILDRMMAKEPDARYASPGEVAAAILTLTEGATLSALVVRAEGGSPEEIEAAQEASSTNSHYSSVLAGTRPSMIGGSSIRQALSPRRWKPRSLAIGLAFFGGAIAILVAVIIIINRPDGSQTVVKAPGGSGVKVDPKGGVTVKTPPEEPPKNDEPNPQVDDPAEPQPRRPVVVQAPYPPTLTDSERRYFEHEDLYDFIMKTIRARTQDFVQRDLYSQVATTMDLGIAGEWRVGVGMTSDGHAYLLTVRHMQWFARKMSPAEIDEEGLNSMSIGRTIDGGWAPPVNKMMRIDNVDIKLDIDASGNRALVGRLLCAVEKPQRVDYFSLVFEYPTLERGRDGTCTLYQHVRPTVLPDDWFEVRIPIKAGEPVPRRGRFHFVGFLFEPKARCYDVSNRVSWFE